MPKLYLPDIITFELAKQEQKRNYIMPSLAYLASTLRVTDENVLFERDLSGPSSSF